MPERQVLSLRPHRRPNCGSYVPDATALLKKVSAFLTSDDKSDPRTLLDVPACPGSLIRCGRYLEYSLHSETLIVCNSMTPVRTIPVSPSYYKYTLNIRLLFLLDIRPTTDSP